MVAQLVIGFVRSWLTSPLSQYWSIAGEWEAGMRGRQVLGNTQLAGRGECSAAGLGAEVFRHDVSVPGHGG